VTNLHLRFTVMARIFKYEEICAVGEQTDDQVRTF